MTFRKTVLAYLTGWLIAQPLYNRLIALWRRRELANPSPETLGYWEHQAEAIVDAAERRAGRRDALRLLSDQPRQRVLVLDPHEHGVRGGELADADVVFLLDPVLGPVCIRDRNGTTEDPTIELHWHERSCPRCKAPYRWGGAHGRSFCIERDEDGAPSWERT